MTESSAPTKPLRILVADDEPLILKGIQRVLEARGHQVVLAEDAFIARTLLDGDRFDATLLDVGMPGGGLSLARTLVEDLRFEGPVVLMTGGTAADTAKQMGPTVQRLQKPFRFPAVIPLLEGGARS